MTNRSKDTTQTNKTAKLLNTVMTINLFKVQELQTHKSSYSNPQSTLDSTQFRDLPPMQTT